MSQFKRCKVVMLPTTNEKAIKPLIINPSIGKNGKMELTKHEHNYPADDYQRAGYKTVYLYITSDDEIKEGDWYLNNDVLFRADDVFDDGNNPNQNKDNKKIIATTDSSLKGKWLSTCFSGEEMYDKLPQPSQQFIEKYIEEYNKGNIITDVLVEYEEFTRELDQEEYLMARSMGINNFVVNPTLRLKINPKDNTITIKKVKDNWNREEIEQIVIKAISDTNKSNKYRNVSTLPNKWIEENL